MTTSAPILHSPRNRKELMLSINNLKARKEFLENQIEGNIQEIGHQLNPVNLLSKAAKGLMEDENTSKFIVRTGISGVLGFALRNLLFPSFGHKLIGGIALKGAQSLVTNKLMENRDLISNASSLLWSELKKRFSKKSQSTHDLNGNLMESN